jgi:hypothetical protein
MTSTTLYAIREQQESTIRGLSADSLASVAFRVYERTEVSGFREWAQANPISCFRRFHVRDIGGRAIDGTDERDDIVNAGVEVVVAYPKLYARYGADGVQDARAIMREDMYKIDRAIGNVGAANHAAGQHAAIADSRGFEDGGSVWFLVLEYTVAYNRDVSVTAAEGTAWTGSAAIAAAASIAAAPTLNARASAAIDAGADIAAAGTVSKFGVAGIDAGASIAAAATVAPGMLTDNGISFPKTAAHFSTLSLATATAVWYCEDASGSATDEIGSLDLGVTGTPSYQQTVSGFSTKLGFTITSASDGYFSDATGINPGSSSYAFYIVLSGFPASITANSEAAEIAGANDKIRVVAAGDKAQFVFNSGNINVTGDVGTSAFPILAVLDHNASTVKAYTDLATATGTHNSGPFSGRTRLGNVSGVVGHDFDVVYACAWVGTDAEGMTEAVLEAFGWTLPY